MVNHLMNKTSPIQFFFQTLPFIKLYHHNHSNLVNQSLNSGCVLSPPNSSTIFSSVDIQDGAKWQFCSMTQEPSRMPFSIIRMAIGPCPWPRESESNLGPPKPCVWVGGCVNVGVWGYGWS